jgi:hypothetical protein
MEESINDLPGGFEIERHYSFLLNKYLKKHPDSSEYEMVKNEVEIYEDFVLEIKTAIQNEKVFVNEKGKFTYDIDYLKYNEKYLEFFKGKLRMLELEKKLEEKNIDSKWEFNAKEKVFLLHQLGILSMLRDYGRKNNSPNSVADVAFPFLGHR